MLGECGCYRPGGVRKMCYAITEMSDWVAGGRCQLRKAIGFWICGAFQQATAPRGRAARQGGAADQIANRSEF
jgi:hypothetical protein